jgi:riboflavin kinase/FMN adenylyltransferase
MASFARSEFSASAGPKVQGSIDGATQWRSEADGQAQRIPADVRTLTICGRVIVGQQLGRTLGFPTANILLVEPTGIAHGIYAATVCLQDQRQIGAVAYVGQRPTVDGHNTQLEVHVLDFAEDLYGQLLETRLLRFIRGDHKFPDLAALTKQIGLDVAAARRALERLGIPITVDPK